MNTSQEFSEIVVSPDAIGGSPGHFPIELPPSRRELNLPADRPVASNELDAAKGSKSDRRPAIPPIPLVEVFGLPIAKFTFEETVAAVGQRIELGEPCYFITANLHYARLCRRNRELAEVNRRAAFLVADGMPLVWWSRWQGTSLPERVTGADLVWALAELAAQRRYRVFLLGGRPGVADRAAEKLCGRFPGLVICGTACPQLDRLTPDEEQRLLETLARSGTQLLFAALGQPKGELWLARNCGRWGNAVAVQIGASLDFIAGTLRRAPRVWQRLGLEWAYRLITEPRRLLPRYAADASFLLTAIIDSVPRRRT